MDSLFPYQCRLQLHFATKMFLSSFYFMAHESGNPFFFSIVESRNLQICLPMIEELKLDNLFIKTSIFRLPECDTVIIRNIYLVFVPGSWPELPKSL